MRLFALVLALGQGPVTVWVSDNSPSSFVDQLRAQASDRSWSVQPSSSARQEPLTALRRRDGVWVVVLSMQSRRYERVLGVLDSDAAAAAAALVVRSALDAVGEGSTPPMEAVAPSNPWKLRADLVGGVETWSQSSPAALAGAALWWLQGRLAGGAQVDVRVAPPLARADLEVWGARFDATLRCRWHFLRVEKVSAFGSTAVGAGLWFRGTNAQGRFQRTDSRWTATGVGSLEAGVQYGDGTVWGALLGASATTHVPVWRVEDRDLPSPGPAQAYFRIFIGFE